MLKTWPIHAKILGPIDHIKWIIVNMLDIQVYILLCVSIITIITESISDKTV